MILKISMARLSRININTITMAWLTKITSHMATAELLEQVMDASMMANSKMEQPMAIFE